MIQSKDSANISVCVRFRPLFHSEERQANWDIKKFKGVPKVNGQELQDEETTTEIHQIQLQLDKNQKALMNQNPLNQNNGAFAGLPIIGQGTKKDCQDDSLTSKFQFDKIYQEYSGNKVVYSEMCKPIVEKCLDGFNGTIFAYGQTTSGKTHTMIGTTEDRGILMQAVSDIYKYKQQTQGEREVYLWASYLEIYNEQINDLLDKSNTNLRIREDPNEIAGAGYFAEGLKTVKISKIEDFRDLLKIGEKARHYRQTDIHEHSSRSHSIFRILIENRVCLQKQAILDNVGDYKGQNEYSQESPIDGGSQAISSNNMSYSTKFSILNIVDLAGSERLSQSGSSSVNETSHINKSLFVLTNVVYKLSEVKNMIKKTSCNQQFIPYRDSKLTKLLRSALGGNSLTAIICTASPNADHTQLTLSTLRFAQRAKKISTQAISNQVVDDHELILEYKKKLEAAEKKVKQNQDIVQKQQAVINKLYIQVQQLLAGQSSQHQANINLKPQAPLDPPVETISEKDNQQIKELIVHEEKAVVELACNSPNNKQIHFADNICEQENNIMELVCEPTSQKDDKIDEIICNQQNSILQFDQLPDMDIISKLSEAEIKISELEFDFEKLKLEKENLEEKLISEKRYNTQVSKMYHQLNYKLSGQTKAEFESKGTQTPAPYLSLSGMGTQTDPFDHNYIFNTILRSIVEEDRLQTGLNTLADGLSDQRVQELFTNYNQFRKHLKHSIQGKEQSPTQTKLQFQTPKSKPDISKLFNTNQNINFYNNSNNLSIDNLNGSSIQSSSEQNISQIPIKDRNSTSTESGTSSSQNKHIQNANDSGFLKPPIQNSRKLIVSSKPTAKIQMTPQIPRSRPLQNNLVHKDTKQSNQYTNDELQGFKKNEKGTYNSVQKRNMSQTHSQFPRTNRINQQLPIIASANLRINNLNQGNKKEIGPNKSYQNITPIEKTARTVRSLSANRDANHNQKQTNTHITSPSKDITDSQKNSQTRQKQFIIKKQSIKFDKQNPTKSIRTPLTGFTREQKPAPKNSSNIISQKQSQKAQSQQQQDKLDQKVEENIEDEKNDSEIEEDQLQEIEQNIVTRTGEVIPLWRKEITSRNVKLGPIKDEDSPRQNNNQKVNQSCVQKPVQNDGDSGLMQQLFSIGVKMQVQNQPIDSHGDKIKNYEIQFIQEAQIAKLKEQSRDIEDQYEFQLKEQLDQANCSSRIEFLQTLIRFKNIPMKESKLLKCDLENKLNIAKIEWRKGKNTYACGENRNGKCGIGKCSNFVHQFQAIDQNVKFTQIECGYHHSLAIDHNGLLYSWGRNRYGQLGQLPLNESDAEQDVVNQLCKPRLIGGILSKVKIRSMACGWQHSLALTMNGFVFSWGLNIFGQLGLGHTDDCEEPQHIKSIASEQIIQISAGYLHSAAVSQSGQLYTWGHNPDCRLLKAVKYYSNNQQQPRNYSVPQLCSDFPQNKKIVEVSCGSDHTVVINNDGAVFAGGSSEWGQLGVPSHEFNPISNTLPYVPLTPFCAENPAVKVKAGDCFTVALDLRGQVWICGKGNFGRQANGTIDSNYKMKRILWFNKKNKKVIDLAVGGRHALALTQDSNQQSTQELYGWGFNFYSQLGLGQNMREDCLLPVKLSVPSERRIKKLSCGYFNSLVLTT